MNAAKTLLFSTVLCTTVLPLISLAAETASPQFRAKSKAEMYPHGLRAKDVIGMNVLSPSGEELGKVSDLIVDARSGQLVYAVVNAGGVLGVGGTSNAVPISALHYSTDRHESFTLDLSRIEFQRAPVFSADQLPALADESRAGYIFRHYHQNWQPLEGASQSENTSDSPLRRATTLIGDSLRSGEQVIGLVEDLVVNMEGRKTALLVDPDERWAKASDRFVVPFSYINPGRAETDTYSARLAADDFTSAPAFADKAWRSNSTVYRWQVGSP